MTKKLTELDDIVADTTDDEELQELIKAYNILKPIHDDLLEIRRQRLIKLEKMKQEWIKKHGSK